MRRNWIALQDATSPRGQRPIGVIKLLLGAALIVGCVSETSGFREVQNAANSRLGVDLHWPELSAEPHQTLDTETQAALDQPLSLETALRVAVKHSPKLRQAFTRLGVSRAELIAAYRPANPSAELAVRFGHGETSIEIHALENLSSILLLPLNVGVASMQREAAQLESAEAIVAQIFRVKTLYLEWTTAHQLAALEQQLLEAQRASALAADELFQAGNLREPLQLSELSLREDSELEVARAGLELSRAEEQLKEALGLWQDASLRAPDSAPAVVLSPALQHPDAAKLSVQALDSSLNMRAFARRYSAAVKAGNLATLRGWLPNLGVGLAAERESAGWSIGPAFGVSVPLFDQGQGANARFEALAREYRERWFESSGLVRMQLRLALETLQQSTVAQERVLRELLPARERLIERVQREYNGMLTSVFDLLRTKRALLQAQKAEVRWRRERSLAALRAEQLLAGSLPSAPNAPSAAMGGSLTSSAGGGHVAH